MNSVKYDSPSDVYKRLAQAGIVSSSDIIQRAIQGYYSQHSLKPKVLREEPNKAPRKNSCPHGEGDLGNLPAGTQIKRHAIRKSLEESIDSFVSPSSTEGEL